MLKISIAIASSAAITLAASSSASAFCGFYVSGADTKLFNNATQVVLMREGTRTVLAMQNNYQGPPENFAMVVPVPIVLHEENVKTLPREVFDRIDKLGAPRLVEYWEEDPCREPEWARRRVLMESGAIPAPMPSRAGGGNLGVKIEAQFTVGEYQVVVLSAQDSGGLDTWLKINHYKIPDGSEPYLRPYVTAGMKFFVAKVDTKKVKFEKGMATLSPLRFHYDSELFNLPVRLGLVNSSGTQDLIVNILAKGKRYEVANYDNVTIPTNIDVADATRTSFGSFYGALFDRTLAKFPKAIVTEYSWDAGSCDPCPLPALTPAELLTLGADMLPSSTPTPETGSQPSPGVPMPPMRGRWQSPSEFVLTRLHTRYGKDTLGEDLVFREAIPIAGGREFLSANGKLEQGFVKSEVNNFQARYAIRHPWTGPIACKNPIRGRWGGPPGGQGMAEGTQPATNLAFAPRTGVSLTTFVKAQGPALDPLLLASAAKVPTTILASPSGGEGDTNNNNPPPATSSSTTPPPANTTPPPSSGPPPVPAENAGCAGCRVGAQAASGEKWAAFGALLAGLFAFFSRRRKS